MTYVDRTLTCVDCGVEFIHSAADQEYYTQKGFASDPKRCASCRASRRASRDAGYDVREIGGPRGYERGDEHVAREYFAVICSSCGNRRRSRSSRAWIDLSTAPTASARSNRTDLSLTTVERGDPDARSRTPSPERPGSARGVRDSWARLARRRRDCVRRAGAARARRARAPERAASDGRKRGAQGATPPWSFQRDSPQRRMTSPRRYLCRCRPRQTVTRPDPSTCHEPSRPTSAVSSSIPSVARPRGAWKTSKADIGSGNAS